jgi:hypothetical protein
MNKKTIIYIVFTISFCLVAAIVYLIVNQSKTNTLVEKSSFEGASKKVLSGNNIILSTDSGDVEMRNFFSSKNTTFNENGDPQFTDISSSPNYSFKYIFDGDQFQVFLLSKPLTQARKEAEEAVINKLSISKEDACKLRLFLYIPTSVDKDLGADEELSYGLSWCPGAYTFEEK